MNTTLTREEKRRKIAEARGWTFPNDDQGKEMDLFQKGPAPKLEPRLTMWGTPPKEWGWAAVNYDVPDYFGDLNACAEMRKALTNGDQKTQYVEKLCEVCGVGFIDDYHFLVDLVDATPEQHCEAFAMTLGLW